MLVKMYGSIFKEIYLDTNRYYYKVLRQYAKKSSSKEVPAVKTVQAKNDDKNKGISSSLHTQEKKPNVDPHRTIKVYRFNGIKSASKPRIATFELDVSKCGPMVLDALLLMKDLDPTLAFRRSCREGICSSCAVNVQGRNRLACITKLPPAKTIKIYPLPHMYVIRDLVVDMTHFFNGYNSIKPYLIRNDPSLKLGEYQLGQSASDSDKMVGLYECVMCACCSCACPSYWWNGRRFLGPATLQQAYRWVVDSRDDHTAARLRDLRDEFKAFRCHTIMNCTLECPKNLNPAKSITLLKRLIAGLDKKPLAQIDPEKFSEASEDKQRT